MPANAIQCHKQSGRRWKDEAENELEKIEVGRWSLRDFYLKPEQLC